MRDEATLGERSRESCDTSQQEESYISSYAGTSYFCRFVHALV
jgi:hypothetical protein